MTWLPEPTPGVRELKGLPSNAGRKPSVDTICCDKCPLLTQIPMGGFAKRQPTLGLVHARTNIHAQIAPVGIFARHSSSMANTEGAPAGFIHAARF